MVCAWAPPPRRIPSGLRAHQGVYVRIKGLTHIFSGLRATNTPRQTPNPPKRRPIQQKQAIFSDCHPIALHFGGHIPSSRGLAPSIGGIALHGGPTRRRHAARRLRVVQNPPPTPMWGCRGTAKYGGGAGVVSGQGLFRGRWRANRRDKIRPARPLPHSTRDKIRPATSKTSNLGCFERAGRTFSRTTPPPPMHGAPESPNGLAAVPVGGARALP